MGSPNCPPAPAIPKFHGCRRPRRAGAPAVAKTLANQRSRRLRTCIGIELPSGAPMFQLSVVDHVRLSFGSVVGAYQAHADAAATLARWGWRTKPPMRALLADVHDDAIDLATLIKRRDALMQEVAAVFEQAPPGDRHTYAIARRALSGGSKVGYSDQDVDEFLPPSLRRANNAPA